MIPTNGTPFQDFDNHPKRILGLYKQDNRQNLSNVVKYFFDPKEPEGSIYIPELNPTLNQFVHSPADFDSLPFEDRVRLLYTSNAFNGFGYRPGLSIATHYPYVHCALDNPYDILDINAFPHYYQGVCAARSLLEAPEAYTPEEFAELRRVADKTSLYHRITSYEHFFRATNIGFLLRGFSFIDMLNPWTPINNYTTTLPRPFLLDGLREYTPWVIRHASAYANVRLPLLTRLVWYAADWTAVLADWFFFPFYELFYKNSSFDRASPIYDPRKPSRSMSGGCGFGTSAEPF